MKALYGFVNESRYDLVIVDTPPSRHALDFFDAPARMAAFFEGRVVKAFTPARRGLVRGTAARLISYVLRNVAGQGFADNLVSFLAQFSGVFSSFQAEVLQMRELLGSSASAFLLVTSPADGVLQEAIVFQRQVAERDLPFAGYVLNQSRTQLHDWALPDRLTGADGCELAEDLTRRLRHLALAERERAARDVAAFERLRHEADGALVCDLPLVRDLGGGLGSLDRLATLLLQSAG